MCAHTVYITKSKHIQQCEYNIYAALHATNAVAPKYRKSAAAALHFLSHLSVPQELLRSSQGLSEEREEVRRRLTEATDRVRQLEEDLLGVTQRGLQKETELDW